MLPKFGDLLGLAKVAIFILEQCAYFLVFIVNKGDSSSVFRTVFHVIDPVPLARWADQ